MFFALNATMLHENLFVKYKNSFIHPKKRLMIVPDSLICFIKALLFDAVAVLWNRQTPSAISPQRSALVEP